MSMNTRDHDPDEHRVLARLPWPEREPSASEVLAAVNRLDAKVDALRDELLPAASPLITGREAVAEFNRLTRRTKGAS